MLLPQMQNAQPNAWGNTPAHMLESSMFGLGPDEIVRALSTDGSVGSSGSAIIGESLDPLVKLITLDPTNFCPLLKRSYTYKAAAINEEFVKLVALGLGEGSFRAQGALGRDDAGQYSRKSNAVKFLGQKGGVTIEMLDAGKAKFGDVKAREVAVRTKSLLLNMDRDFVWGDDTLNSLAWKGLLQQSLTDSEHLTDLAVTGTAGSRTTKVSGGTFTTALSRQQAALMLKYGAPHTALLVSPFDKYSISSANDDNNRFLKEDRDSRIGVGLRVDVIKTDFGDIEIVWDIWLAYERGLLQLAPKNPAVSTNFHPEAPVVLATAPTGAAQAGGSLPPATFFYGVAPVSEIGPGPIKLQSTGYTTDNTNGTVRLTITNPSDAAEFAKIKSYRVYRSTRNGSAYGDMEFLKEIPKGGAAGGTFTWDDDGALLPGSRRAMQMDERMQALGMLREPTMRDLPMTENVDRFTVDAHAVVQNYAEERTHTWYNIGGKAIQD